METNNFYPWTLSQDGIISVLKTSHNGLTQAEAANKRVLYGRNKIGDKSRRGAGKIFLSQFENWLVFILVLAAGLSFFLGEQLDAIIVLAIISLSVLFGFLQEYKAEESVEKLKALVTNKAKVLRNGKWEEIASEDLVLGDIVRLNIGDKVPADIRLFETDNFALDESLLSGESKSVSKSTQPLKNPHAQLYQKRNIAFSGSFVATGTAQGCVVAIGEQTEIGKTAKTLAEKEAPSDFQKQISIFSRFLFKVVFALTAFVFAANALLGKGVFDSFLFALALAVGITPELLPMIITITLSSGALKMAKHKVIIKRLIAVEDFGNIDTLCCDKTGTLTEGTMTLADYQNVDSVKDGQILKLGLFCSSGYSSRGEVTANPIDRALWSYFAKDNSGVSLKGAQMTDENEFDFTRRMMSVVINQQNAFTLIVKGAPESVLTHCSHFQSAGKTAKLTGKKLSDFTKLMQKYETDDFRVLAVATKTVATKETSVGDEKDLTLKGWLLFTDPVKKTAKQTLLQFVKLGVGIKIISGDAPEVVYHAAREVGLEIAHDKVITGSDLDKMSDTQIAESASEYNVFARVTPEQKYRLVSSLNHEGHIVGYLGDGVNDAAAIKAADVGIAVDSGAEIAKEAADIILLQKDLHILAAGILQGRKTFGNITKYILNTISANYGNMLTVALSSLFLPFIPLLPKQILLNNFISDVPLLTISTDHVDASYTKKPKRWDIGLIGRFMLFFGLVSSVFDFATILPLLFVWRVTPEMFRTAWFIESCLSEIVVTFAIRTQLPFYKSRPSVWLLTSSLIAGFFVIGVTVVSTGQTLFSFALLPLTASLWLVIVLAGYFATIELLKHFFFKKFDTSVK